MSTMKTQGIELMPQRLRELAVPVVALVVLRPGDLLFLDELLEAVEAAFFLGLIEADADEFDALVVVLGVELFHLGHLGHARAAPGRPEVDHDDLALAGSLIEIGLSSIAFVNSRWNGLPIESLGCAGRTFPQIVVRILLVQLFEQIGLLLVVLVSLTRLFRAGWRPGGPWGRA